MTCAVEIVLIAVAAAALGLAAAVVTSHFGFPVWDAVLVGILLGVSRAATLLCR